MGLHTTDLNNVNLNDDSFDKYHPKTIIYVRPVAWCNKYIQRKKR